jgi:hypothetical protein
MLRKSKDGNSEKMFMSEMQNLKRGVVIGK